ncbi:MAG: hypothetical protein U0736_01340 [Gemmataceae bacterium]
MRPILLGWLVFGSLLLGSAPARGTAPFAGNWRVIVLDPRYEASPWLVGVGDDGKVRLLWGLAQYGKATLIQGEARAKELAFTVLLGRSRFAVAVPAPETPGDLLPGAMHAGGNTVPVWLERTEQVELNEKTAVRPLTGGADLEAARKQPPGPARLKALRSVIKKHPGTPVAHLASQQLMTDLVRAKADPETVAPMVARYLELVRPHGPNLVLATHVSLAQGLLTEPTLAPLAVESAREAVRQSGDKPLQVRLSAHLLLVSALERAGKGGEVRPLVPAIDRLANELIGTAPTPALTLELTGQVATLLLASPASGVADLGLKYARRAVKDLKDDVPLAGHLAAYKLLAQGLEARGKKDEARTLAPRIERMETDLDDEYQKKAIPFDVEKSASRKGKNGRVALVELFTGAQNPLCQASDLAFAAALQSYPDREVAFLQYHSHVPLPDALTIPDGEARQKFYGSDREDVPAVRVDGKATVALGGERQRTRISFDNLREAIDKALDVPAEAKLRLRATRRGDVVEAQVDWSDLKTAGRSAKLRIALVEDRVRYQGRNGLRLHYHVVRALLGGAAGVTVDQGAGTHTATVDLEQLRTTTTAYLDAFALKHNIEWTNRPLDLKGLRVVAWIQDDAGKQVSQAAQAEVAPTKAVRSAR